MKLFAALALGAVVLGGGALVMKARAIDGAKPGPAPVPVIVNDATVAEIEWVDSVELAAHIDPGGDWTIFAFGAVW